MSWHCNACGGEHPDTLTVCRGGRHHPSQMRKSTNPNARICQHCAGEIPETYDYCPCQSHWENFANR